MTIDGDVIAIWGAVLSTLLAFIKLFEVWSARRRIEVSHAFYGRPEIGNDIIIRNISNTPLIITYWELQFCEKKCFRWRPYRIEDAGQDNADICIQGHSSKQINFSDQDYFEWGKALLGKRLYLKFKIAGKSRSERYLVYKG